ncbi:LacI family DNA-binding transcriptional regulator [Inquilinus sp. CAU 1745]|uniref:LacI family DNA-binding transcriptional regulator n=1 Tax=Inquilinus sp. CAU 1745 TaxID=3140369 RepID=UPI00325BF047
MNSRITSGRRATLLDVAREAEVSRATASLVLRKSPLVGTETRKRVEAAMARVGYVYNLGAARMRAARSRTVGVVIPSLSNPFFAEMLAGIEATLDEAEMGVIFANTRESLEKQKAIIRRMREHGVDGLIICPAAESGIDLLERASEWGLPLVQALRYVSATQGDYSGIDYFGGMRGAADYLIGLGHRRIGFVSGNRVHSAYQERLEGFRTSMEAHGLPADLILTIPLTHAEGMATAERLLEWPDPPSAALCFNDVVALGLLRGLHDRGVEAGVGFSVVGFDNVPEGILARPTLTSVSTRPFAVGRAAAKLLLGRLDDPAKEDGRLVEPTELVVRQSSGAPRGTSSDRT